MRNLPKRRIPLRLRVFLQWVLIAVFVAGFTFGCLSLTTGAWDGLVTLVSNIIEQGPAAIISAIIAGGLVWYCVLPALAIIVYAVLVFLFFS